MTRQEEIQQIVEEYNRIEGEQAQRLTQLFKLINAGKSYRHARFSNGGMWSNCWDRELRLILPVCVDNMTQQITEIVPGSD